MKNVLLYLITSIAIFFTSCGTQVDSNENLGDLGNHGDECFEFNACNPGLVCEDNTCVDAIKLTKDTIIVTSEESENSLIEHGENKLVFLKNKRTSLFKKDYILAFSETEVFENGFIGVIKSVEFDNDKVVVTTEAVSPFEILGDIDLKIDENIDFDQPIDPRYSNTDRSVNKTVHYNKSIYRDTLKILGDLSIKYRFKLHLNITRSGARNFPTYKLNIFKSSHDVELNNNLDLKFDSVNYVNERMKLRSGSTSVLAREKAATFSVVFPYGIKTKGEVYLSVKALYSGLLQGKLDTKIKTKSKYKSEINYLYGVTKRVNDFNNTKLDLDENVKMDGQLSVSFKVIPEVIFKAYNTSITNNVSIASDIVDTPVHLNSTIDTDNANSESCYSLEGIGSISSFANLDLMTIYRRGKKSSNGVSLTWKKELRPRIKNFNWLEGDKECHDLRCDTDLDCRVDQATAADTCNNGSCLSDNANSGYQFVEIPEGDFTRGCVSGDTECRNDETPAKTVHLTAYKIGKYEASVNQYKKCVNAGVCTVPTSGNYLDASKGEHPINSVTWLDAQRFCSWVGSGTGNTRLPTEAEWENAAKGGTNSLYPWGNEEASCDFTVMADNNGGGCGEKSTAKVGSKLTDISGFGVMDMGGNVSEYTNDYYDPSYYTKDDAPANPKGPIKPTSGSTYISHRGGTWDSKVVSKFRSSRRFAVTVDSKNPTIGIRCVYKKESTEVKHEGTVDNPIELGTLTPGYTHSDSRDTNDATSKYFDKYPANNKPEYGKEFIYHFKVTEKVRIRLNIDTPEPSGTDIDLHLFRTLSASSPGLVQRDNKEIDVIIEPGDYYISMDSYGKPGYTQEGKYKLNIEVFDVLFAGSCDNIEPIKIEVTALPFTYTDTKDTNEASYDCFDKYPPNAAKEFGKENIYHLKLTEKVNAKFYIQSPEPNGTDIDLQLFKQLNVDNPILVTRDDKSIATVLEPGDYYLSLDSYGEEGSTKEGVYKLTVELKEYIPVSNEGWFNEYILKAVAYIDEHHTGGGYNLHKRYTHKIKYGPSEYLSHYSGDTYTMCSAAVNEVVVRAMQIYLEETGDASVFTKFTRRQWDNKFIPWQFPYGSTGSKGFGDAVKHFNMGEKLPFKDLLPGAAISYNRERSAGHTVIFLGFLDKQGVIHDRYPSGKTVIGFKFYSSQGTTNGMGYKLGIWGEYRDWAKANFCNNNSLTKGVTCDTWKKIIRTGTYGPNSGMLYMPAQWNPSF